MYYSVAKVEKDGTENHKSFGRMTLPRCKSDRSNYTDLHQVLFGRSQSISVAHGEMVEYIFQQRLNIRAHDARRTNIAYKYLIFCKWILKYIFALVFIRNQSG